MQDPWVEIKYEGIEGQRSVLLSSFNKLYKRKGWKLVNPPKPVAKKKAKKVESDSE